MSETDAAWIETALTSARPQAVGALLRYFRDLDTAEEDEPTFHAEKVATRQPAQKAPAQSQPQSQPRRTEPEAG